MIMKVFRIISITLLGLFLYGPGKEVSCKSCHTFLPVFCRKKGFSIYRPIYRQERISSLSTCLSLCAKDAECKTTTYDDTVSDFFSHGLLTVFLSYGNVIYCRKNTASFLAQSAFLFATYPEFMQLQFNELVIILQSKHEKSKKSEDILANKADSLFQTKCYCFRLFLSKIRVQTILGRNADVSIH